MSEGNRSGVNCTPGELGGYGRGDRLCECSLADTGDVGKQHVPPGEERNQTQVHHLILADDHAPDGAPQLLINLSYSAEILHPTTLHRTLHSSAKLASP